jgi:hypothetical protein
VKKIAVGTLATIGGICVALVAYEYALMTFYLRKAAK